MKMNKRLLSLILAAVMVVGMFPLSAIAVDGEAEHIDTCLEDCTGVACECACHQPAGVNDDPVDLCPNCDVETCTGCDGIDLQNDDEDEDTDPVCTNDPATCTVADCECKQDNDKPLCDKCNATETAEGAIKHEPTCPEVQYVPECTGKVGCPVEGCTNDHCTGVPATCPITDCECKQETEEPKKDEEPKQDEEPEKDEESKQDEQPLCDKCEATKDEKGEIVHAEDCETLCNCTPTDGVHQPYCNLYEATTEATEEATEETTIPICPGDDSCAIDGCENHGTLRDVEVENNFIKPVFFDKAAELLEPVVTFFRSMFSLRSSIPEPDDGIELSKTVTTNDDGTYTLRLESYVTGQMLTDITNTQIPSDIVIIIDESGSMNYCIECGAKTSADGDSCFTPASKLDTAKTYFQGKKYRYYCNVCCGWFNEQHTASSHGGTHVIPFISSSEAAAVGQQFYTRYENDFCGSNCSHDEYMHPIYYPNSKTLPTDQKYTFYQDGKQYNDATYCSECDRWYRSGRSHAEGEHTSAYAHHPIKFEGAGTCTRAFYHTTVIRLTATKTALNNFLTNVFADADGKDGINGTADDVDHRVAIVGFTNGSGGDSEYKTWVNPNNDRNRGTKGWEDTVAPQDSLRPVNGDEARFPEDTATRDRKRLTNAVSALGAKGGTPTQEGLYMAQQIFLKNKQPAEPDVNGRNKVCILFTDGAQRDTGSYDFFHKQEECMTLAKSMKDAGVAIYSIGIFGGADASNPANLPTCWLPGDYDPESTDAIQAAKAVDNCNLFMHLASSNYPSATSMDNAGTINPDLDGKSYYLSAGSGEELNAVFQSIASQIQQSGGATNKTLTSSSVVRDIITPVFQIPKVDGSADTTKVRAWTETYKGKMVEGNVVAEWSNDNNTADFDVGTIEDGRTNKIELNGNIVTVTGFDFSKNYVGMDSTVEDGETTYSAHGKKLVLEIIIEPIPGFLGGDNIATNESDSGIYESESAETATAKFPIPQVDIAVKQIKPQAISKDIYLSQWASLPELVNVGTYTIDENGNNQIEPEEIFTVDTLRNSYVDIVYTIDMPNGQDVITYTINAGDGLTEQGWSTSEIYPILTADTTYPVTCTVTSAANSANTESEDASTTVQVYKPVITFNDTAIELGEIVDYEDNGGVVVWKHGDTVADPGVMGTAPELIYTYSPEAGAFKEEQAVQVTVTAKQDRTINVPENMDITEFGTFYRDACTHEGCDNPEKTQVAVTNTRINFKVHVKSFDLTIVKAFPEDADYSIDAGQTFVFNITGPNGFKKTVIIEGEGEVTITGLPVGDYTVTEDTGWSWRYECDDEEQEVNAASVSNGAASITFTNTREEDQWLDGNDFAANKFNPLRAPVPGFGIS